MKMTFHGHSCWEIQGSSHRVLIDPFLTGNELADVGPGVFDKLDGIIITHGHGDHIGDGVEIAKKTGALVVSNFEIANYFGEKGCTSHPLHIGGGAGFPFGHVKLTIAHHGSTGPGGESLGSPAGVVLTIDGKKIYHAGDTGLFLDMKLIAEMNGPLDAALLPIGDNFTMGIADAVKAAEFVDAKVTIPMHYKTFPYIEVDPNEFIEKVNAGGRKAVLIGPGESYELA
ncbi:MAG: metal-dependent hydrolase [Candidatus Latescibacterota bacterium]|nr:MAG: metal-dependent hydrolase [Candidatus Latescibacterota bacterium]